MTRNAKREALLQRLAEMRETLQAIRSDALDVGAGMVSHLMREASDDVSRAQTLLSM